MRWTVMKIKICSGSVQVKNTNISAGLAEYKY